MNNDTISKIRGDRGALESSFADEKGKHHTRKDVRFNENAQQMRQLVKEDEDDTITYQ